MSCFYYVCVVTAGTSCDDCLLYLKSLVRDLVRQMELCFALGNLFCFYFYIVKDVF